MADAGEDGVDGVASVAEQEVSSQMAIGCGLPRFQAKTCGGAQRASWNIKPSVCRTPECRRLTPWRMVTR